MTHDEALHLLSARIDAPLSPDQSSALELWLAQSPDHRILAEAFQTQHLDLSTAFEPRRAAAQQTANAVDEQLATVLPLSLQERGPGGEVLPLSLRERAQRRHYLAASIAAALLIGLGLTLFRGPSRNENPTPTQTVASQTAFDFGLKPRAKLAEPKSVSLALGEKVATEAGEKRRVVLPDGSLVYLNQNTKVELRQNRQLKLLYGEVFVEAVPADGKLSKFLVETPKRSLTALGTKFAVSATDAGTGVVVTQGKVEVAGLEPKLTSGQELLPGAEKIVTAPRASAVLDWTRDLMAAAESPLVPSGKYSGGSLVAIDPYGQEAKLSMVKYHVDVHIEDGFARTTIDQTYFNSENTQLEGTFYFPLPADASLSQLAMYVDGVRMEGGMAERDHARNVYETIRYQRRDPALLEWVDGSLFKMRVFPLEARQEKRIILSYTQKLPVLYGRASYRFPAGHTLSLVNQWSFKALVKDGTKLSATTPSHPTMKFEAQGNDLVLSDAAKNIKADRDVVLELTDHAFQANQQAVRWSTAEQDGQKYLMVRYRPDLPSAPKRERRDWVILFEASGARDPLVARTQVEVIRSLLTHAEHEDTFAVLTVGTRVRKFSDEPQLATRENIAKAITWLEGTHLIGALNLEQALYDAEPWLRAGSNPHLVHVGGGIASLGEQRADELVKHIPTGTRYVGIGVGKRVSPALMHVAAEKTGGLFTQVNPDEPVSWRGFEIASTLNAPRLFNVQLETPGVNGVRFLAFSNVLAHGEELAAVANVTHVMPTTVTLRGLLDCQPFVRSLPLSDLAAGANYLPRTWAKLEIDRLMAESSTNNRQAITELSKVMYVMTPFTSLLVLENEAMYKEFKVDRGRKDHWAMYQSPDKIPVVYIPDPNQPAGRNVDLKGQKPHENQVLQTVLVRAAPQFLNQVEDRRYVAGGSGGNRLAEFTNNKFDKWQMGLRFDIDVNERSPAQFFKMKKEDVSFSGIVDLDQDGRDDNQDFERKLGQIIYVRGLRDSAGFLPASTYGKPLNGKESLSNLVWEDSPSTNTHFQRSNIEHLSEVEKELRKPMYRRNEWKRVRNQEENFNWETGLEWSEIQQSKNNSLGRSRRFTEVGSPASNEDSSLRLYDTSTPLSLNTNGILVGEGDIELLKDAFGNLERVKVGVVNSRDREKQIDGLGNLIKSQGNRLRRPMAFANAKSNLEAPHYYTRPSFNNNSRVYTDLVSYARGMTSSPADIQAVIESEAARPFGRRLGSIDPAARKIIDAARTTNWKATVIPLSDKESLTVIHDGQGRYRYERTLELGLIEHVICDGTHLWHLYPELGVGAKRTVSRCHRQEMLEIAPDFVLPADDLNEGADVKAIDAHTVALVPLKPERIEETPKRWLEIHLVFSGDRLSERRWVIAPEYKVIAREVYEASGTTKLVVPESKEKEVVVAKRDRRAVSSPDLKPDLSKLVVLPLPAHDRATVYASLEMDANRDLSDGENSCYAYLNEEAAMKLLACEFAANDGSKVHRIWEACFHDKGDMRPGFFTLMVSTGTENGARYYLSQAMKFNPDDVLLRHLWKLTDTDLRDWHTQFGILVPRASRTDFLGRLETFRYLTQRLQGNFANHDRWGQRPEEERRGLRFVEQNADNVLGWCVLGLMTDRIDNTALAALIAEMWGKLAKTFVFPYEARYEAARCWSAAEKYEEAQNAFQSLFRDALEQGILPPLDATFRAVLERGDRDAWAKLIREAAEKCAKAKARPAVITLAWMCYQLGDLALSDSLLDSALKDPPAEEKPFAHLAAIYFLNATNRFDRADELIGDLLGNTNTASSPRLWRLASTISQSRQDTKLAMERLEKALAIEFEQLPDVFDVQPIRSDYGTLLTHYEWLADASATLRVSPPADLVQRVVKAADRWRMLDTETEEVANRVSKILRKIGGENELAWDYATTPLAMKPGESGPWISLAWSLRIEGDWKHADRCYALAFAAEPTNAQLLWDRSQYLEQQGQIAAGRKLKKQLADGDWQPRFAGLKAQAKQAIGGI